MKFSSMTDIENGLFEVAKREAQVAKMEAQMNARINTIKEKFDDETRALRAEADLLRSDIEAFCIKNKFEFEKVRSKECSIGTVGFRTNPPKVMMLNRKYNIKTVLELLKRVFPGTYVRTKEDMNRDTILADYSQKKITDEQLAGVGLKIDQEESFFIDVKWEKLESEKASK
jgi:phage host-nuclease inhibitor protein Gam